MIFTGLFIGMILTVRFYTTLELEQIEILQIEFVEYSSCSRMVNIHYCMSICCKKYVYIYIYICLLLIDPCYKLMGARAFAG